MSLQMFGAKQGVLWEICKWRIGLKNNNDNNDDDDACISILIKCIIFPVTRQEKRIKQKNVIFIAEPQDVFHCFIPPPPKPRIHV